MNNKLTAGAATTDITPKDSQFLFGYPHVKRYSTGVHDQLTCSALCLDDGGTQVMFIANDIIFVPTDMARRVRKKIEQATGVPAGNIMITATHTHSGPITVDYLSNEADPIVPKADAKYLELFENAIFTVAVEAHKSLAPAKLGLAVADATGIGTNRRDPQGACDMEMPVMLVKAADGKKNIAAMLVCCMHPTVLHEDSPLVSGDFPAATSAYLKKILGNDCCIVYHTGPEGNQSPRHVTKANTFEEATRLGEILGKAAEKVVGDIEFTDEITLAAKQAFLELPSREFPPVDQAKANLRNAVEKLDSLQKANAPRTEVRTAECDWFGAEETLTLAKAAVDGKLDVARQAVMPAEIQVIKVGEWKFVGWPGEMFIEFDLEVKSNVKNAFVIALANGELQGYIVTPEAAAEGGYEASNALFDCSSGKMMVDKTLELLADF